MHKLPYWMLCFIHKKVGEKAALIECQMEWQLELSKSQQLIEIENKERTEKIRKITLNRMVL